MKIMILALAFFNPFVIANATPQADALVIDGSVQVKFNSPLIGGSVDKNGQQILVNHSLFSNPEYALCYVGSADVAVKTVKQIIFAVTADFELSSSWVEVVDNDDIEIEFDWSNKDGDQYSTFVLQRCQ